METPPGTALVVVGMHRSGTSAVTQLLAANGFRVGDPEQLLPPNVANVHGHFEHVDANAVNIDLLTELGGSWFAPPAFDAVEAATQTLTQYYAERIDALLAAVGGEGVPVVKDPRATLVLPIWAQALPGAVFVACVRSPLAVARSLTARDSSPLGVGLALWEIYNAALLRWLPPDRSVLVDVDVALPDVDARQQLVEGLRSRLGLVSESWEDTYDPSVLHPAPGPATWRQYVTGQQAELHERLTSPTFHNDRRRLDAARDVLADYSPDASIGLPREMPAAQARISDLEADLASARTDAAVLRDAAFTITERAEADRRRLELDVTLARSGAGC